MTHLILLIVILAVSLSTVARAAEADVDDSSSLPATEALERSIPPVEFQEARLDDVMARLAQHAQTTITLDLRSFDRATDLEVDTPITLSLPSVKLAKAIELVLGLTSAAEHDLGYYPVGDVIYIGCADLIGQALVTRVYDVRDLIMADASFMRRAHRQSTGLIGMLDVPAPIQPDNVSIEASADALVQLIESVAVPNTWRSKGGTSGAITVYAGHLFVVQTSTGHTAVLDWIRQLRKEFATGPATRPTGDDPPAAGR